MRVVQINCVYKKGSTGKIVFDLHEYYTQNGIDSYVVYGRGKKTDSERVYKCASEFSSKIRNGISRYTGNIYGMGKRGLGRTMAYLKKLRPDVVHLQCINGFFIDIYGLLKYLKKQNIPTLLTLHAEFMHTGNCGYAFDCEQWNTGCQDCENPKDAIGCSRKSAPAKNWKKMQAAFKGFQTLRVVGVSDWISNRAKRSAILKAFPITTVLNGLDDTIFRYDEGELYPSIKKARSRGEKTVLFVSPYFEDENKGGRHVLRLIEEMKEEKIRFIVVGNAAQEYNYENAEFIGCVSDQKDLARWYSQADVCLLASRQESFSMITAESLCCGTPIVGFEAGAPEGIAIQEYSDFVPYGDTERLKQSLLKRLKEPTNKEEISKVARAKYAKETMAKNYVKEYEKLLSKE